MTSEDTQAAANMGIKLPEPYCRTGDSMAPTLQPLFSAEQMQAMFEVGRSRAASEPGEVAPAPDLSSDTVVELQMLEEHLERWARGECLSAPKNGYDDPGHRTASMRDVTKTLAFLLPRFKNARAALLKFAVEYEQFKSGTYSPEDEGAGWPFPSSSAPQPASSPVAAEGQKADDDVPLWKLIYGAIMSEDRKPVSIADFDRASMRVADMIERRFTTPTASMADAAESGETMDMALCEIHSVVIRPGQRYTFSRVGDCEKCAQMEREAAEAYGEPTDKPIGRHMLATPGPRGEHAGGVVEALSEQALLEALTGHVKGYITNTVRLIAMDVQRACATAWGLRIAEKGDAS